MTFFDKLNSAIAQNNSLLVIGLDPNPEMLPDYTTKPENSLIENLENWLKLIIQETSDRVCAYKPTLGFYQALGIEGLQLLSNILSLIPEHIPIILDAKYGDINSSGVFAKTIFEKWQVDAVTLTPYTGQDQVAPFLVYPDKGVFILCHTINPGAIPLQDYPTAETPFYLQVIREAKTWGTPEQLFLEVGTNQIEILTKIRSIAPERIILMRNIWHEDPQFNSLISIGLDKNGQGLLIVISQEILRQENLGNTIKSLNQKVNEIRNKVITEESTCELWTADVCLLKSHPHQDLILQLYDIECLLFGEYVQASGATFSYYIDLRRIISNPQVFHQVLLAYAEILKTLNFERIAGIPYGSLPTATGLSLMLNHPMIFPRKEVKAHGTRRLIEGQFHPGEKVVIVEDVLITGKSAIEGAEKLQSVGLIVEDIVVLIDHEEGVKDRIKQKGYNAYSVLTISEITETLYQAGRITAEQYNCLVKKN